MNKWYFVCSILIVVIIVESVAFLNLSNVYVSLSSSNDSLKVEHQALTEAHDSLSQNYSSLKTNYTNLESEYNILQTHFGILQSNYSSLQTTYQNLQANYAFVQAQYDSLELNYTTLEESCNSLQINYTSLEEDYNTLEVLYNSLQTSYNNLQAEYDRYAAAYQRLRDEINQRWNEQNVEPFITPPDPLLNTTVFDITGGWSNTSDWSEYWEDVKAMCDWVVDNIEYRSDGLFPMLPSDPSDETDYFMEMWQFPNETLTLGKGDCEDMAILLCSMIRCYNNMEYYVECIGIVSSTAGHLAVQIPVAEYKLVILDPAGRYCSCDLLGNIVFRDVSEEINNWLDYWKPKMGEDVYVNLVFSDYIHETFTSTADYLSWMYSR
jgi:hypothetical protein